MAEDAPGAQKPTEHVNGLDFSFQGLRALSSTLFQLEALRELVLDNNELELLPRDIWRLQRLERLSAAYNRLRSIPPELGRIVSLRELHLHNNLLHTIPMELGTLYNLEVLTLHNNPLIAPFSGLAKDRSLIHFCRENNTAFLPPQDRAWVETMPRRTPPADAFAVGTYNILCNFYAARCTYAPSWVIAPDTRRDAILRTIVSYNVDILGVQEIEAYAYADFYRGELEAQLGYASLFQARERTGTLVDKRSADGCALFWRRDRFTLRSHRVVYFNRVIASDTRFGAGTDAPMRLQRKDNIAIIAVLADRDGQPLIVLNTHLYWDPAFADVKLFETVILLEELAKTRAEHAGALVVMLGDYNSMPGSAVHSLITGGSARATDFLGFNYGPLSSGWAHSLPLHDAYAGQDQTYTTFTPTFRGIIDHIFHSAELEAVAVLSPLEEEYMDRCVGLPSIHFPSDHVFIGARLALRGDDAR